MHGGEGVAARRGGLGAEEGAQAARRARDMRRRVCAAGAAGLTLCVALGCLALADYGDGSRGRPGSLESAANTMMKRLNYLNDYSVKTTDVDKELENFRIERDVAIAAIGHSSLTTVPTETPKEERERLLKLRTHAMAKLHRINRGRRDWSYGLKSGDLHAASRGDCDEGDEKLGLCGVSVPSPNTEALSREEEKVNKELTKKEEASDAARAKVVAAINRKRLEKANTLMAKLSKTDALINELVHHTVKVSQMPAHAPDTRD